MHIQVGLPLADDRAQSDGVCRPPRLSDPRRYYLAISNAQTAGAVHEVSETHFRL